MPNAQSKNAKRVAKRRKPARYVMCRELKPDVFAEPSDVRLVLAQRDAQRRDRTQELETVVLPFDVSFASDSSGNIQQVYANDPTNSAYWTVYRANYDQYRVLGVRFTYEPNILVGGSSVTIRAPVSVVTDYDDSASLTAYSLAETYSDHQRFVSDKRIVKIACEQATVDMWTDSVTSSPNNQFWIKTFSAGNTPSTTMGRVLIEYVVQFKGRGI